MAGPTPVSALIHAATMVTAGIYMIARSGAYIQPHANDIACCSGYWPCYSNTCRHYSDKANMTLKVLAYSTVSQLGFMFLALGVGA